MRHALLALGAFGVAAGPAGCDLLAACTMPSACPALAEHPPPAFDVRYHTSAGNFTVRTTTSWAPPYAARFWRLARVAYMDGGPFYRVDRRDATDAFVVQFGYRGDPLTDQCWDENQSSNDTWSVHAPGNVRGTVAFAMGSVPPNSNCTSAQYCAQGFSTSVFINYADNSKLDASGFSIFGRVLPPGMDVVDRLYAGYGECAELCPASGHASPFCIGRGAACAGVSMDRLLDEGADYWRREKPRLDFIRSVEIVSPTPAQPARVAEADA